jgi:thiamine pyrophosphokinase
MGAHDGQISMLNSSICIFANGTLQESFLKRVGQKDFLIGVDRAAHWLIRHAIIPDIAIGDFDSVSGAEFATIQKTVAQVIRYPPEKDRTDLDLAVQVALQQKPNRIVIYGGWGTRMDHSLGAIQILEKYLQSDIPIIIRDNNNELVLIDAQYAIHPDRAYPYVSVLPVTDFIDVSLSGLKYPLSRVRITRGQSLGVSNEIIGKTARITIHQGKALVIRSRD